MRLFPFALTQSEDSKEQLPATSPVSLSQTHLPQNTFRRLSLPFRPRPPAATLPELDRRRRKAFLRMRLSPRPPASSLLFTRSLAQDQDRPPVRHSEVRQSQERRHFPRPQRLRREGGSRETEEISPPLFVSVEGGGRSSRLCRSVSRLQPVTVGGLFGHFLWPVRHSPTFQKIEKVKWKNQVTLP